MGGLDEFGIGSNDGPSAPLPTDDTGVVGTPLRPGGKGRLGYADDSPTPVIGGPFKLGGEFISRRARIIETLQGIDQQSGFSSVDSPVEDIIQMVYATILEDATKAPFRTVGLGWYESFSLGVTSGQVNGIVAFNASGFSGLPPSIYVIDEIKVGGGNSDFQYGTAVVDPTSGGGAGYQPERKYTHVAVTGATTFSAAKVPAPPGLRFHGFQNATPFTDGADNTGLDVLGYDSYGGSGPMTRVPVGDVVLFPSEAFMIQQLTISLAFKGNIRGRSYYLSNILAGKS